jgi:aminomethyltransferase
MRETVLRPVHEERGARMVPFAGWKMPVEYRGILEEARAVRNAAGLFDLGHMGRVEVRGPDTIPFLQKLQTNDASKIAPGKIRYAMILDESGRTQDDILVYHRPDGAGFFVVINAGNADRDLGLMRERAAGFDVEIVDRTDELGMIAVQGPKAVDIMRRATNGIDFDALRYYSWADGTCLDGVPVQVSRTGYTGEDGFELYLPADRTVELWRALEELGAGDGLIPCGLGARDVLRLEAGMPLYGHEIDETTTPWDAGLAFGVKLDHDFVGREALVRLQDAGTPDRHLIGLVTESRRCPRQGYKVLSKDGEEIGIVCSGAASPTLGKNIATAYVRTGSVGVGDEIAFEVRAGKPSEPATVVALPFYKRER